jgi:phosphate transport system protein
MTPDSTGFRHFHDQLSQLKKRLLEMSERSEALVELSMQAVLEGDVTKAQTVIAGDRELDQMELELEEMAVQLLALQQPMARDLRVIISAIKITSDLERVGDHAVNIAQAATRIARSSSNVSADPALEDMARRARQMLSDALDSFVRGDGALGRDVCARDDQVDALHDSTFRVLLTHMLADPRTINLSLDFMTVSRNLERVADLATNIAEDAVFVAEGKTIKHRVEGPAKPARIG